MAKKIKAKDCQAGKFYILDNWKHLFFCLRIEEHGAMFQQVGSDFRVNVYNDKVKPVSIFMFTR